MEIQINSRPVDFELSGEKTIAEVVNSIADWTKNRNLVFAETAINNHYYPVDKIPDIPIDDIDTLNCIVLSKADIVVSSMNECMEYCARSREFFKKAIAEGAIEAGEIENAAAGIDWISEVLGKISDLLGINPHEIKYKDDNISFYVERIISFKNSLIKNKKKTEKLLQSIEDDIEIFSEISNIFKMLLMSGDMNSLVIQSTDSPDVLLRTLSGIKDDIHAQLKNLEEIAVLYQTGNDRAGAEKLDLFINFIFNYKRACFQIVSVFGIDPEKVAADGISLNKKNSEIKDHLNNIIKAMENNDIISLSDILEYEMKSSLENLDTYIDALVGYIEKKV